MALLFVLIFMAVRLFNIFLKILNLVYSTGQNAKVPDFLTSEIDETEFQQFKRYNKEKTLLSIYSDFFDTVITLSFLFLIYKKLEEIVSITENPIYNGILFFAAIAIIDFIISLPFSLYDNFSIEKRYGFNTMTPGL